MSPRQVLAILALLSLGAVSVHAAEPTVGFSRWNLEAGATYFSWKSDLDREGHELLAPFAFGFKTVDGKFQTRFTSAFAVGRYRRRDLGFGGSDFSGSRLTDSSLGLALMLPWGSNQASFAVNANLPTGDQNWEIRQSEGNLPLVLSPTRYRGRSFGLNALGGLGRDLGAWSVSAALGYFYSGSQSLDVTGQEVDLGNYAIAGLSLARGRAFRFRFFQSLAQDTKVGGQVLFRAPSATVLDARWSMGRKVRVGLDVGASLFGKARRTDLVTGDLAQENSASFGTRLSFSPALEYGWGPKVSLRTAARFKDVLRNGYGTGDILYEGGGTELGASQEVRWKTARNVSLDTHVEVRHLVNRDAGTTVGLQLTGVSYDVVSVGTKVNFQW